MVVHEGITPSSLRATEYLHRNSKLMDLDLYKYIAGYRGLEPLMKNLIDSEAPSPLSQYPIVPTQFIFL